RVVDRVDRARRLWARRWRREGARDRCGGRGRLCARAADEAEQAGADRRARRGEERGVLGELAAPTVGGLRRDLRGGGRLGGGRLLGEAAHRPILRASSGTVTLVGRMVRIVLPDATSRDAIDDLAAALGFLLINIVPRTEAYPAQVIYLTPDRRAMVHLVDEG